MKSSIKIAGAFLIVALVLYGYRQWLTHSLRGEVDETRRLVRQQGFKADLSDFDFASSAEIDARAAAIIAAGQRVRSLRNARELQPMDWIGTNIALAVSRVEIIETHTTTNLWPLVQGELAPHDRVLDDVCASLFAGPVKFQRAFRPGGDIALPYLADYKTLVRTLALRAAVAMYEHDTNRVFTNVLAVSRLVTSWTPEPLQVAHTVRFACAEIAQKVLWEWMQSDHCKEAMLAALQRDWDSVRFFEALPRTAELSCARIVRACQVKRNESYSARIGGWRSVCGAIFRSPSTGLRYLWHAIKGYRDYVRYQNAGSYDEEKRLLIYFRDQHEGLKRALQCSTWSEMRTIPGATNLVRFEGAKGSPIGPLLNLKQMTESFQGQGRSLMAGAAEAETRRRLIVTAIALKRFAVRHGAYPQALSELVPAFVPNIPMDFMDGKELRYCPRKDGRYLLYSVGLDCVDNGGSTDFLPRSGADLVWPLPATQADVDAFKKEKGG